MIKLEKSSNSPLAIQQNQHTWTKALLDAVNKYGSYNDIPTSEKNSLTNHYKNTEIKTAVFNSSNEKCCFCESKLKEMNGYPEIEHFEPKSLYPEKCFEWTNLMPICRNCNGSKKDHDTISEPIVNPFAQNPKDFFEFKNLRIKSLNDNDIGQKTIEICNLNRRTLIEGRSNLYLELEKALIDIENDYDKDLNRNKILKLENFIFDMEKLASNESKYSAFVKNYLDNSNEYKKLKQILENHS